MTNSFIQKDDGVIFFNFRPDRARQLTSCFVQESCPECRAEKVPLAFFLTPVSFGKHLANEILYAQEPLKNTLKEVLAHNNRSIYCIAETEKYAHITYFFGGRHEKLFPEEIRILIPSIKASSYADYPEMSAAQITQTVIHSLQMAPADFYLINYANADMVGHSGNLHSTIQAIEYLDTQLALLEKQVVEEMNGTLYITADHGKAEAMVDYTGAPQTAHTSNPVPFIMIEKNKDQNKELSLHELADVAPFILKNMGLSVPEEMQRR